MRMAALLLPAYSPIPFIMLAGSTLGICVSFFDLRLKPKATLPGMLQRLRPCLVYIWSCQSFREPARREYCTEEPHCQASRSSSCCISKNLKSGRTLGRWEQTGRQGLKRGPRKWRKSLRGWEKSVEEMEKKLENRGRGKEISGG